MINWRSFHVREIVQRWRPSQILGCDCGSGAVKAVRLVRTNERTTLIHSGMHEIDWGSLPDQATSEVAAFLRKMEAAHSKGGFNLPYAGLLLRPVELAKMPERDLQLALRWQFRKDIDGPLENLDVAYTEIMKAGDQGRRTMMAYGVEKSVLEQRRAFARELGLRLTTLEPTPSALLAAFANSMAMEPEHGYAVVDVGFERSTFLVFAPTSVIFARELPGVSLQGLSKALVPGEAPVAERRGMIRTLLNGKGGLTDVQDQTLREFYRQWLVEIQRASDTFIAESKKEGMPGLGRIHLCGGGALLPEITQVAHKNLGVEAVVWNPFAGIVDTAGKPVTIPLAPLYATAVGLALPNQ